MYATCAFAKVALAFALVRRDVYATCAMGARDLREAEAFAVKSVVVPRRTRDLCAEARTVAR